MIPIPDITDLVDVLFIAQNLRAQAVPNPPPCAEWSSLFTRGGLSQYGGESIVVTYWLLYCLHPFHTPHG